MSRKQRQHPTSRPNDRPNPSAARPRTDPARPGSALETGLLARIGLLVAVMALVAVVVIGADAVLGAIAGGGGSPASTAPSAAAAMPTGVIVQGQSGHWTNVSPDGLAAMLTRKDFTLLNVKTPYSGEIDGTDLYIPYDQLTARASQLPANKSARILVYCRSGVESAMAAQTLVDLGYTNVWNLDGGMNAWQASGQALVQKNR